MSNPETWSALSVGRIEVGPRQLSLAHTLCCGQAFRWWDGGDGWWHGVVAGRAIRLRGAPDACLYQTYPESEDAEGFLRRYLRLDVDLTSLAADLARRDQGIRPALAAFPGLRVVGQEPEETLLSYLCSPANSVMRISRSLAALAIRRGRLIARLDGFAYHAFPTAEELVATPEPEYRAVGLGWRGRGIRAVASLLLTRPGWLDAVATRPYEEARSELLGLPNVGPKIADCVCLFGMRKDEAVPVDTHVWALARELFPDEFASGSIARTLTPLAYERVRRLYQSRYGPYAGWAQEYLYHWRRQGYPA